MPPLELVEALTHVICGNFGVVLIPIRGRLAYLKNWKMLATGYRGRLTELPNIICIITKLEYYRLGW